MAIIGGRTPAHVRRLVRRDLRRGRAISARAAIRVHGAVASRVTNIRAVVCGRAAADAGRLGPTTRIAGALVVRASSTILSVRQKAATVRSVGARGVGGARLVLGIRAYERDGRVWLASGCRTALRGAGRRRAPVLKGNLCIARRAGSVGNGGVQADRGIRSFRWRAREAPAWAAARTAAVAIIGGGDDVAGGAYLLAARWLNAYRATSTRARCTTDSAPAR